MSSALCNGDKRGFAGLLVRSLVVLLLLVSTPLNAFAMNGPVSMHSGGMSYAMTNMSMMDDHVLHGALQAKTCQMMTQCNAALAMPARIELADKLFRFELTFSQENLRERVVQPPYHPPIV